MMNPSHERRALLSVMGAVETLYTALEHSSLHLSPDLCQELRDTFDKHRRELAGEVVAWPQEPVWPQGPDHE